MAVSFNSLSQAYTRREKFLQVLYEMLHEGQPVAISGPSGVGKTRIALEFATRFSHHYKSLIWMNAATPAMFLADCIELAERLGIPLQYEQKSASPIQILRDWLSTHQSYLLILDNVDDSVLVKEIFSSQPAGHVLLTTSTPALVEFVPCGELSCLNQEEGMLLVLNQAGLISSTALPEQVDAEQRVAALELAHKLDGLPLALELAGTYIAEARCSIRDYLQIYYEQAACLAASSIRANDHAAAMLVTCSLSFAHLEKTQPMAAELLRLCVLLAPGDIPVELFAAGTFALWATVQANTQHTPSLDQAIEVLLAYRLIKHQSSAQTLCVYTPVRSVLRDRLSWEEQQSRAEQMLRGIHSLISSLVNMKLAQQLLFASHIQQIAALNEAWTPAFPEAAEVFCWAARVLSEQEIYEAAEQLLEKAHAINKLLYGSTHPTVATVLYALANLHKRQKQYMKAQSLLMKVNLIRTRSLGSEHPDTILSLSDLGSVYAAQGKSVEAETIYRRALTNCELALDPNHSLTVMVLDNMATLYLEWPGAVDAKGDRQTSSSADTDALPQSIKSLWERVQNTSDLDTAKILYKLALIYMVQENWEQAEASFQRVLQVYEIFLGSTHADVLQCLEQLALCYRQQERFAEAEAILRRVIETKKQALGSKHPNIAVNINALADIYLEQGKFEPAEQLLQSALAIFTNALGTDSSIVGISLSHLAATYLMQEKYEQALPIVRQAFLFLEQHLGSDNPEVKATQEHYQRLRELLQQ